MTYRPEKRRERYLKDRDRLLAWQKQYDDAHRESKRAYDRERYKREKGGAPATEARGAEALSVANPLE
jgi:hypothetical protein